MDITNFKRKLQEGIVDFSYLKKDGTVRNAKGTTNAEYLPKSDPIVAKFNVEKVLYCTKNGSDLIIPEKFKIDVYQSDVDEFSSNEMVKVIESIIKRRFGGDNLIIENFAYYPINNSVRRKSEDIIMYFDIDKSDWRSFRFDQLIQD